MKWWEWAIVIVLFIAFLPIILILVLIFWPILYYELPNMDKQKYKRRREK